MTVVHIGLGKTATTALQKRVFSALVECGAIANYNPKNIMRLLYLNRLAPLTAEQRSELSALLASNAGSLISFEGLVDWNPDNWAQARDENLEIFGKDATILITIRDAKGYLTSVYQQVVAEGHVVAAKDFFVTPELAQLVAPATRRGMLETFNQQAFDLEALVGLYREKFAKVIVVAMPKLGELSFLDAFCTVDDKTKQQIRKNFETLEPNNRSYSKLAMTLTLRRERLLRSFGIRSQSTHDFDLRAIEALTKSIAEPNSKPAKRKNFLQRTKRKAWVWSKRLRRWRYLMQVLVNRRLPYKKFELPSSILNQAVIAKNDAFYKSVLDAPEGYLTLKRLNGRNRKS